MGTARVRAHYDGRVCLLIILLLLGPRAVILVWWLLAPLVWDAAFGTLLVPILGFLFLPWTTLVYVLVVPGGVGGLDVLWLVLAFLLDVSSHVGVYGRRRRAVA
ncbi:hypothetical protein GCM10023203_33330 [Actinomycetospora straminea]|uniref:Uncharacterized protein n=1 Tax=Actinomycetospora straminea TaxID=663607 RepID=A0ABP9EK39_9PSEU